MFLLYRHPLRGGKVHNLDPEKDELLSMGENALFIEHPFDKSNRPNEKDPSLMPWTDVNELPYTICGPYLKDLFERAFIEGLHNPDKRPSAGDWEEGLIKTIDLLHPCENPLCEQKWFVFDNETSPVCPFCGWNNKERFPVLHFYSHRKKGVHSSDNHRFVVHHNRYLYPWHVYRSVIPNEKLAQEYKTPVGYFVHHKNKWIFVNRQLTEMKDLSENKKIPTGSMVELKEGKQIVLSGKENGRVIYTKFL